MFPTPWTRRRFLGTSAALAGGLALDPLRSAASDDQLTVRPGAPASRVVQVTSAFATDGPTVHQQLLREMVERTITTLTGEPSAAQGWRALLSGARVVGLKFNRSGQYVIGTTAALAETLVGSLADAGWPPSRVICIEAPDGLGDKLGTLAPLGGYESDETDFGSGADQFAAVLGQVDAIISVPFLKTHNIATMTGALKNLSHGLIKHPARYHADGCAPFVGDIVAAQPIRSRLRLALIDALRVVYRGGPTAAADRLSNEGALIASIDAVAADSVGLSLINAARSGRGLAPLAEAPSDIPYLAAAHRRGLGIAVQHAIDSVQIKL